MTRRSSGALALALLVAACAPDRTQPSEPTVSSEATAHVTGHVPYLQQDLYDIVDETGASIWQPYTSDPPTQASFTMSVNWGSEPCTVGELLDEQDTPNILYNGVSCGGGGVPGHISIPNRSLASNELENCTSRRAPYPFAMTTADVTCQLLARIPSVYNYVDWKTLLAAAPTAPGDRVFRRWEVTGGNGDPLPCEQGQASLQCMVTIRTGLDWEDRALRIRIKLHYGPATYDFSGFFRPVDNLPTVNTMRAGRAVPINFSLGGDRGLNVLAAGSPSSQRVDCSSAAPLDAIEETVTAGESSLSYDLASDTYTYVWKTERTWAGTCRDFTLALNDGSAPTTARFNF